MYVCKKVSLWEIYEGLGGKIISLDFIAKHNQVKQLPIQKHQTTKKTIIPSFVSEQGRGRECPMGDILKAVSFLAMFL